MRLIDAGFAQMIANTEMSDDDAGKVQWVLSHTPTAYNIDDVIYELKSKSFIMGEESNDDGCYTDSRFSVVPLDVAIEIVKRGGV